MFRIQNWSGDDTLEAAYLAGYLSCCRERGEASVEDYALGQGVYIFWALGLWRNGQPS